MSSKVLPGDNDRAAAMAWRQVGTAATPAAPSVPVCAPVDPSALREQLQRECEHKVAQARAAAYQEGEAAGRKRAAAELQPIVERMTRTIEEIASLRARLRREAEADTVKLAIAIARRIIRRELAVDPDALHGLVLGALEKLQMREICRVRVHPTQAAGIAALIGASPGGGGIEIVPDGAREPGSAVFETERGNLDASVESQLGEIERGLADLLRRQS